MEVKIACRRTLFTGLLLACCSWTAGRANEFVGVLTLALEDDVAVELGLSKSIRNELRDLVDQRESKALELAYAIRDLPKDQQRQKLEPFRRESEQLGLALLTESQQEVLEAIRVSRLGVVSLGEPKVAKEIGLTAEQQSEVGRLLVQRQMQRSGGRAAEQTRSEIDGQLRALLSKEQLTAWQQLSTSHATGDDASVNASAKKASPGKELLSGVGQTSADGRLRFSFRYAPWSEVIQWFAAQAELSLIMDAPPQGTLNYTDPRDYTPAQAIDLLNSVLLTKGYTLVRRDRMLMVINLEDGIPPNLITEVSQADLASRGEYELVRCLFTLTSVKAVDAEQEISRLVGPQGEVVVLESSNQLLVRETAGRLRTFQKILEAAERKNEVALGQPSLITLAHIRANAVIGSWRKLMGLAEEENATPDGSLRVAQGKSSRQLVASGQASRVQEFKELVKLLDRPAASAAGGIDAPQLEVYAVTDADPESVLEVMQTLLGDLDEVRLASDPKTGNLVALATPAQHRTIRATIDQMQKDPREVAVIRLRMVDPQLAMMSIEKLFGPVEGEEATDPNAPRVDADPVSRSLLIRGSQSQIAEIRELLAKMGEQETGSNDRSLTGGRGNLRMIPVDAATARRALEQMNSIWPTVRTNQIRVVTPSSSIRGLRRGESSNRPAEPPATPEDDRTTSRRQSSERLNEPASQPPVSRIVRAQDIPSLRYVVSEVADSAEAGGGQGPAPPVIVTLGDQGLLIASEDLEALDDFEQVFSTLADRLFTGSQELAVYYLKFAKAEVAAELLKQFVGGGSSGASGGGGSLLGTLAGAALGGGDGGGLIGSLLGMGGNGGASSRISSGASIIADPRLNALVVQASPKELDFIEQILEVLDTPASPEAIETIPRPRTILVLNASAEEIAKVIRSVYASRLTSGQDTAPRQPSPEEFLRAMSGQQNPGRTIKDAVSDQLLMNISVDTRRNALIVVATHSLFLEVKELVAQLDFAEPELRETIRYGQTSGSSPEVIRSALASIIGQEAGGQATKADVPTSQPVDEPPRRQAGAPSPEQLKRQMEFLKAIQGANAKLRAQQAKQLKQPSK